MQSCSYFTLMGLAGVALTSCATDESASAICDVFGPPYLREEVMSYAVVVPWEDTLQADSRGAHDVELSSWQSIGERILGSQVYGQVATLIRYGGYRAEQYDESFKHGDSVQALLVPWDISAECKPAPWKRGYRWLPADSSIFVIGVVREKRYWKEGRPVVDVPFPRFWYPEDWIPWAYTVEVALSGEERDEAAAVLARSDSLPINALEFFSLFDALPTWDEVVNQPEYAEQRLRRWERDHPELLNRKVVQVVLRGARAGAHNVRRSPE